MHSSPELSSELPVEHKQTNDPLLFTQSAFTQGLDTHSSTSAGNKMNKMTDPVFAPGCLSSYRHPKWIHHWPSQTSCSGLKRNPLGHWQVKLPGVFLHRPLSHNCLLTRHSSISEEKHTNEDFVRASFWCPIFSAWWKAKSLTNTVFACQVDLKAFVAGAFVCSPHVLTDAILAQVRIEGTLINIWEDKDGRLHIRAQRKKNWSVLIDTNITIDYLFSIFHCQG